MKVKVCMKPVKLTNEKIYIENGRRIVDSKNINASEAEAAYKGTMAYSIISAHNEGSENKLKLRFDALASHDITYVGIIQTARASGLAEFPLPYVLTNCHNSLCAVGGTINEDDHVYGLSAAKKYGGIYVPAHQAVIHSYMREVMSGCGKMILGSDSHTRYGALGTMGIGEGGPELVKQLLCRTYDIDYPRVIAVLVKGEPRPGVGPQDAALALIGEVFKNGFVKNAVMEFIGDGIKNLPVDYRCGIDVMTTETSCLSSIWETDEKTEEYFALHNRPEAYKKLTPAPLACYDALIELDLSALEPMIALPFHPSNVYTIRELNENASDILRATEKAGAELLGLPEGRLRLTDKITKAGIRADQGVIAGCAGGTFDNLCAAADILRGKTAGNGEFALSFYPQSQPVLTELMANGCAAALVRAGASLRSAFCGPCFGAGDVPANNGLSIRHTTRNFPNREGSKPGEGQIASVALMDARSIAATAANGGIITAASESTPQRSYRFDSAAYESRVYNGYGKSNPKEELKLGPNITDWPEIPSLAQNLAIEVVSVITDEVTTTDELIPSGESSSYRSNPLRLANLTLSRKDPAYVGRAKASAASGLPEYVKKEIEKISGSAASCGKGSAVAAIKPGDGSAREQAASCQRVLGGCANIAHEYATKRYRSNLINWGMLPLLSDKSLKIGDFVYIPGVRECVASADGKVIAYLIREGAETERFEASLGSMTEDEKEILLSGCLMNYYRDKNKK